MSNEILNQHIRDGQPCGDDADIFSIADHYGYEIARLNAEIARLTEYKTQLSTELTAYMVACEELKEQNARLRAALESIAGDWPVYYDETTIKCEMKDIAREALGER